MPIYLYEVLDAAGEAIETVELLQGIHAEPYTTHPESGAPVRRVLAAPRVPRKWSDARMKSTLSDNNLERLGFTKYQKVGDGKYEKRVGSGPDTISRGDVAE